MIRQTYLIAEHKVTVSFAAPYVDVAAIIPSFQPFVIENTDENAPVLDIVIDNTYRPQKDNASAIGTFPSIEYSYDLYARQDEGLIVEESLIDSGEKRSIIDFEPGLAKAHLVLCDSNPNTSNALSNALMLAYAFSTAKLSTLVIHSSTVNHDGRAYMFLGKSGTGKSTHSRLWLKNVPHTKLMNDDNPIIRIYNGNEAVAYGSPWSGKTPCYRQVHAPIGALVDLHQAKANKITALMPVPAFIALLTSVSTLMCYRPCYDAVMNSVIRLAEIAKVYSLECLPDDDAAKLCSRTVCE